MPTFDDRLDDVVAGNDYQVTRTITLVPSTAVLDQAWFTVKEHPDDADAAAIIGPKQITSADVPGTGQITDTGADGTGAVRFDILDTETELMQIGRDYHWGIQVKTDGGALYEPVTGLWKARQGVTVDTT